MDAPEVDPRLHRAAQALRERQVLFCYCAEEVATARHNAMFQRCLLGLYNSHAMSPGVTELSAQHYTS